MFDSAHVDVRCFSLSNRPKQNTIVLDAEVKLFCRQENNSSVVQLRREVRSKGVQKPKRTKATFFTSFQNTDSRRRQVLSIFLKLF